MYANMIGEVRARCRRARGFAKGAHPQASSPAPSTTWNSDHYPPITLQESNKLHNGSGELHALLFPPFATATAG